MGQSQQSMLAGLSAQERRTFQNMSAAEKQLVMRLLRRGGGGMGGSMGGGMGSGRPGGTMGTGTGTGGGGTARP
jgi:hypothetical protein